MKTYKLKIVKVKAAKKTLITWEKTIEVNDITRDLTAR